MAKRVKPPIATPRGSQANKELLVGATSKHSSKKCEDWHTPPLLHHHDANHVITKVMGQYYYFGSVLRQSTHARAQSLVEWLSGSLDLSLRMCARAAGIAGAGVV
jgi:hypothetical protein